MNKDKFKYKFLYKSLLNFNNKPLITIFTEDYFVNPTETNLLNFYYYNNDLNLESLEENYENIKNFKYIYIKNYKNLLLNSNNFLSDQKFKS
jgi:hypothetical protein